MSKNGVLREFNRLSYNFNNSISKRLDTLKKGEIEANKVLFVGDLHLTSDFKGSHVDYTENCKHIMGELLSKVMVENYDTIIFTGDFLGVKKGVATLKDRSFLVEVIDWLKAFWEVGCVPMSIRGNHDNYKPNDFELLVQLGYLIDLGEIKDRKLILRSGVGKVENEFILHLVPHGFEQDALNISKYGEYTNIVVAHNNYYINGREEFFVTENAIDLTAHEPFYGAELVLSGDIHVPGSGLLDYTDGSGAEGYFLNLGCPTRPSYAERYNAVWLLELHYAERDDEGIVGQVKPIVYELKDEKEVFRANATSQEALRELKGLTEEEEQQLKERNEQLDMVLRGVKVVHTESKDFARMLDSFIIVSDEAKSVAKEYIRKAVE